MFTNANPYGKYFLGPDNIPGGRNRARRPARGAYVVDGGVHELYVGQCINSGVSYGAATRACTPLEAEVTVGLEGQVYLVL